MCGNDENGNPGLSSAVASAEKRSISPDIISVTEVLDALERSNDERWRKKSMEVLMEAMKRDIILKKHSLDSIWELDLSGMSFPVAHAVCRFVFQRMSKTVRNSVIPVNDLTLITGVGFVHRNSQGDEGDTRGPIALREYVRETLRESFTPPIYSSVPRLAQGTIVVKQEMVQRWVDAQK